jgi:hypothetical protein
MSYNIHLLSCKSSNFHSVFSLIVCRIYTLLSTIMIQIYQLRKTDPISTSTIEEHLEICMDALEQVSKTWLVATMVHKLFQIILGWCEIKEQRRPEPRAPTRESSESSRINLSDLGAHTPEESDLLNFTSRALPHRSKPLTPGLKDYMAAALQYIGASQSNDGNGIQRGRTRQQSNVRPPRRSPLESGLQFLPEDQDLEWDDDDSPRTPASTGLNPAIW